MGVRAASSGLPSRRPGAQHARPRPFLSAETLRERYYLIYTALFVTMLPAVFFAFIYTGTGFVWDLDGMNQHYQALVYYGRWLRGIAASVIAGAPAVPLWDFSIGYGSDVISTLNYYAIGDPLTLVSAFVPARYGEALYYCLDILRFYLAGVAFSAFCRKMGKDPLGTLAAAFAYAFCGWALTAGITHPFFLNPLIYLPLMLLGFEKLLRDESPVPFALFTALAAASNFYFFYMLVIAVLVYALARFFAYYGSDGRGAGGRSVRNFVGLAGRAIATGVVGVLMAGIVLLPSVLAFLNAGRSSFGTENPLVYSLSYYKTLPAAFVSTLYSPNYAELGYSGPLLLGVFALFSERRSHAGLKAVLVVATAVLLTPAAGAAMNGFSYATNRWVFEYSFLAAYLFATAWPGLVRLSRNRAIGLAACAAAYALAVAWLGKMQEPVIVSCTVMGAALAAFAAASAFGKAGFPAAGRMAAGRHARTGRVACTLAAFVLVLGGVAANGFYDWDPRGRDAIGDFVHAGTVKAKSEKTAAYKVGKLQAQDPEFNRIDIQTHPVKNTSINARSHTTQYFWSVAKGDICDYMTEVGITHRRASDNYYRLEARAMLESLASVKYYVCKDDVTPYGFTFDEAHSTKKRRVYTSENAMPFGYVDDRYIARSAWLALDQAHRQEALFQATVVEDDDSALLPAAVCAAEPDYTHEAIGYRWELGEDVVAVGEHALIVGRAGATARLCFEGRPATETYVQVTGMNMQYKTAYELYMDEDEALFPRAEYEGLSDGEKRALRLQASLWGDRPEALYSIKFEANGRSQDLNFSSPTYRYSSGQRDFLLNLGYSDRPLTEATLTFPQPGLYTCDDLKVISQPFGKGFHDRVEQCRAAAMIDEGFSVNGVSGTVDTVSGGLLRLSMPYDRGWTAYVDGERVETLHADGMFMGVPVEAGRHRIELAYMTYGLPQGAVMTAAGLVLLAALAACHASRRGTRRDVGSLEGLRGND